MKYKYKWTIFNLKQCSNKTFKLLSYLKKPDGPLLFSRFNLQSFPLNFLQMAFTHFQTLKFLFPELLVDLLGRFFVSPIEPAKLQNSLCALFSESHFSGTSNGIIGLQLSQDWFVRKTPVALTWRNWKAQHVRLKQPRLVLISAAENSFVAERVLHATDETAAKKLCICPRRQKFVLLLAVERPRDQRVLNAHPLWSASAHHPDSDMARHHMVRYMMWRRACWASTTAKSIFGPRFWGERCAVHLHWTKTKCREFCLSPPRSISTSRCLWSRWILLHFLCPQKSQLGWRE